MRLVILQLISVLWIFTVGAQTPAQLLFPAVQYLQPRPANWSASNPLENWGGGVSAGGCRIAAASMYSLTLDPTLFTINRTLRLDLLGPSTPLCSLVVLPVMSPVLSLDVVANFSGLPDPLQVLRLPSTTLTTYAAEPFGDRYVEFTNIPSALQWIDLSNTGMEGNLDLSKLAPSAQITFIVNVSNNPGLYGWVDLLSQGICGLYSVGVPEYAIDLRSTSVSAVVAAVGAEGEWCVEPSQEGQFTQVFVDSTVEHVSVDPTNYFLIDYGYYCLPPMGDGGTDLPVMNYAYLNGFNVIRMVSQPYLCEYVLTTRFASFVNGYIFDSTSYGPALWPCLNHTVSYVHKTSNPGAVLAVVDTLHNVTLYFGQCPDHASALGDVRYYSVSINETTFFDFYTTGLNVTARGIQTAVNGMEGTYRECFYSWHYFVESNVQPPLYEHIIYNDAQLIATLNDCFPTMAASGAVFGSWMHATYSQTESQLIFRDNVSNMLTLSEFQYAPIFAAQYCLVTPTNVYLWNVSKTYSTLIVSTTSGVPVRQCNYSGIFQYLTQEVATNYNIFYAFDHLLEIMGPCMPLTSAGSSRQWSSLQSRLRLAPDSFIFGDLLFVDDNGTQFDFSANSCIVNPTTVDEYCSSVDLFTGSLVLNVYANRSTRMQYYRRSTDQSLQNVTTCDCFDFPLMFDAGGTAFFFQDIVARWSPCFPQASNTATFTHNITGISYNSGTDAIMIQSAIPSSSTLSIIQFTHSVCDSLPIIPSTVQYCPPIETFDPAYSVTTSCQLSLCRPMNSVEWESTSASQASWISGSTNTDRTIKISEISSIQGSSGIVSTCYPPCYVNTANCSQIAFVISNLFMCYVRHGLQMYDAVLPAIPQPCILDSSVITVMSTVQRYNGGGLTLAQPELGVQCVDGGVALLMQPPPDINDTSVVVAATSEGTSAYALPGGSIVAQALQMVCTPCTSLWLQKLYPTPLLLIAINAMFNMLLVITANYIVQPLVGAQIVKLKVRLLTALGALSRREVRAHELWLSRCLRPYIASQAEIKYHVDMVCKIVNAERKKIIQSQQEQDSLMEAEDDFDSVNVDERLLAPPSDQPSTPRSRPSPYSINESEEQRIGSDEKFRHVFQEQLMCGTRMLGSVGEISLRKLVELRDACTSRPMAVIRTNYIRFPTQKKRDSFMTELTAEKMLLKQDDDVQASYEDLSDEQSMVSMNTAELQLEDAIAAIDADSTAEWIPYVLAHEWMDRQFLSPMDWLLFLQLLLVLVIGARTFDIALSETGAKGSWEVYSAFYFLFIGSSAPVSLVVNAVFRVLYTRKLTTDTTQRMRRFRVIKQFVKRLSRDAFFMVPFMLLFPAIVTHIIPGLFIFPFVLVCAALMVALTGVIRVEMPDVDEMQGKLKAASGRTIACILTRVLFRQMVMFACVASIQLAFSYSMMFYASSSGTLTSCGGSWVSIVDTDFNARSIVCTMVQVSVSASSSWHLFYSQFV